jgi:zinc transport system substrate-binding protein
VRPAHLALALTLLASGLAFAGDAGKPAVWVTIPPQRWLVERLADDLVTIAVLVAPGQSHETYEPTPKQIAALEGANLYIRLGVPFEDLLVRRLAAVAPRLEVVDGRAGIELLPMAADHDDDHHHGNLDPHFWLDPSLFALHAGNIAAALARLLPAHTEEIDARLDVLRALLETADRQVAMLLAPFAGRTVLVYHPAFGYFTHRYGLEQVAVEVDGKEPTARQLAELVDLARRTKTGTIFLQPQFSGRAPQALAAAIGGNTVPLDPLAEDYVANLEIMADLIATALGGAR